MNEVQTSGGTDRSQVMLAVLVVLAFIASVVMLFTDSDNALKIALLAALWAAIIGFFLVFRYRREAEAARHELIHRTEVHEIDVARATAEREARSEARALELRDRQRSRDTAVLEDIQRELAGIRTQLETLAGRTFEYEPAALRAEAHRIMELEEMTLPEEELEPESEVPEPVAPPEVEGRISGAPSPDAIAGRLGQQPTRPESTPLAELIAENQRREKQREDLEETRVFDTGSFQAVSWGQGGTGVHTAPAEPAESAAPEAPEKIEEEPTGGRRRRDENTEGVSVAELLARARENRGD